MDLLLRSNEGNPTIGEVKVKNDRNAFFALVQAMTYAVEMSTPNQIERLRRSYPADFKSLNPSDGHVEIAVILVNPVEDATRETVLTLIRKLNERGKCPGLRRVFLLRNEGNEWIKDR